MNDSYRIVFNGAQPGKALDEIKENLARLFRVKPEQVTTLIKTPGFVVKRGVDLQTANRFQVAMQGAGCVCVVESEESTPGMSANTTNAAPATSPPPVLTKQNVICSGCAATNPASAKFCLSCGTKLADVNTPAAVSDTSAINSAPSTLSGNTEVRRSQKTYAEIVRSWGAKAWIGVGSVVVVFLYLFNSGGGEAGSAADLIIKDALRSPSSYSVVSQKVLWTGKDETSKAYIVKTDFDAQNGFGGTIRDCYYTAFSVNGKNVNWNKLMGVRKCSSDVGDFGFVSVTEEQFIKNLIEMNHFSSD